MKMKKVLLSLLALLLLLIGVDALAVNQIETPRMRRFGPVEGLPSRMVLALAQDRQGYIWAATSDGLARYDGIGLQVWRHDPADPRSIPGNQVETLLVDDRDRVWIGANGSPVGMLDAGRKDFAQFPEITETCVGQVWSLAQAQGAIWIGTSDGGLCRREENGRVTAFRATPDAPDGLPSDTILSMVTDARGRLWIATASGLVMRDGERFVRIAPTQLSTAVLKLSKDPDGTLWVGSSKGLYRVTNEGVLEPAPWAGSAAVRAGTVVHDVHGGYWVGAADGFFRVAPGETALRVMEGDRGSGFLTAHSGVLDVMQDRQGGLWLGMISQGMAYLPPDWQRFSTFFETLGKPLESLYLVNVAADGERFLVTTGEGVYRVSEDGAVVPVVHSDALGGGSVQSVLPAGDGNLWIAMREGITRYTPATGGRRDFPVDVGTPDIHRVELMAAGIDGEFWLSIVQGGVQRRAADGHVLATFRFGTDLGMDDDMVQQLLVRPDGSAWAATGYGLWVWQGERFRKVIGDGHEVYALAFVSPHEFWAGRSGALERYSWDGSQARLLERIGRAQGIPATDIRGLALGGTDTVWATTSRGLLAYRRGQPRIHMFGQRDGLPDSEFSMRPPVTGPSGQVLALTTSGIVLFDPSRPFSAAPSARLVIESVQVRRNDAERSQPVSHKVPMVLQARDRDLRISARLLSFVDPASAHYRYRIDGYDERWVEQGAGGERVISRLPPGDYRIEVQARAGEGDWVAAPTLQLEVRPPWWLSTPAQLVAALLCVLLSCLGVWTWRRRVRRQQEWVLAQQRQQLAEQASVAKSNFLANLGHEVRTPMTGVLGMSELLLATPLDAKQRSHVDAIRKAGAHLLRLVNDALDLARIEAGKLELVQQPFDPAQLTQELADFMHPISEARGLRFHYRNQLPAQLVVLGDATRVRQILINLLGNAIKFSERGEVSLTVSQHGEVLRFKVRDSGPGIGPEQQKRLFQRFEQADGARTSARYGGSGLGLAICQELTVAMKGAIRVRSRLGVGTQFSVDLPLPIDRSGVRIASGELGAVAGESLRILLVEDDPTVAEVISGLLMGRGHRVVHAAHGLAALSEAVDGGFDIALLDLDLPGLDGFALASQLRRLGHGFPLLAVTARADGDAERQAQAAGFDGFLRKPVTADMLIEAIAAARKAQRSRARSDDGAALGVPM
ncbi:ATP-binding protein [Xanthomonas hortorum pv. hederae]|uniref:histidine kinase n=2 Tax=Xanthomonas hortorum TaxID=56454 RepID=A0A9X4HA09_9XANT|nr:hybrid sensor histidine kinase/response regulator [Xanthomonas hortorum]MCE4370259.1 ATP-binding protein [Xanthomonas hortorum pv. hederae]MDC8640498.1 ATP-binding protein [Xanthomonas hortorum pv. hederae]PPU84947.1 histidine kinase [Xanthomonas hortorum pv. hederae]PUF01336.1 histidine kinase [Xanthomonas hortorum pv. hederae]